MSGVRLVNCSKRETVAVDQLQWQWQVFGCGKPRAGRIPGESSKRPAEEAETWELTIGQKIGNAVEIKESCTYIANYLFGISFGMLVFSHEIRSISVLLMTI